MAQVFAVLEGSEDEGFGVSFPDFPGSGSSGPTVDAALARAKENLAVHIGGLVEVGAPMPRLRTYAEIVADPEHQELLKEVSPVVYATIDVDLPGKAVRVNVTIEESLLKRIDQASDAVGESRSAFLAKAARERLAHL